MDDAHVNAGAPDGEHAQGDSPRVHSDDDQEPSISLSEDVKHSSVPVVDAGAGADAQRIASVLTTLPPVPESASASAVLDGDADRDSRPADAAAATTPVAGTEPRPMTFIPREKVSPAGLRVSPTKLLDGSRDSPSPQFGANAVAATASFDERSFQRTSTVNGPLMLPISPKSPASPALVDRTITSSSAAAAGGGGTTSPAFAPVQRFATVTGTSSLRGLDVSDGSSTRSPVIASKAGSPSPVNGDKDLLDQDPVER